MDGDARQDARGGGDQLTEDDRVVAEIAGRVAASLATKPDQNGSGLNGPDGIRDWVLSIAMLSVGIARQVVAHVYDTSPGQEASE